MTKKTFVVFGLLIVFLAVLIPWLVFRSDGDAARGAQDVPADLATGQSLFQTNCGNCHTLYAAGSDGNFAPDLDVLLAPNGPPSGEGSEEAIEQLEGRVLNAIDEGVDSTTTPGRMPAGILSGEQAKEVAEFVARTAGEQLRTRRRVLREIAEALSTTGDLASAISRPGAASGFKPWSVGRRRLCKRG